MQIERGDHRDVGPDDFTDHRENLAIGVLRLGGDHRAVVRDIHPVERHRGRSRRRISS